MTHDVGNTLDHITAWLHFIMCYDCKLVPCLCHCSLIVKGGQNTYSSCHAFMMSCARFPFCCVSHMVMTVMMMTMIVFVLVNVEFIIYCAEVVRYIVVTLFIW
jgi:hypothetical protein